MSNDNLADPPKLIYVGDPMCSWCYGLTDELSETLEHFKDKVEVEFVMGGLRPYHKVPIKEMQTFLAGHWQEVHEASGQEFNYGILERADLNYDTEPPCRAVVAFRSLAPHKAPKFFKCVQSAFYFHNMDMNLGDSYKECIEGTGVTYQDFEAAFNSTEMKQRVKGDFKRAKELGVSSFPTILLEYKGDTHVVASGYAQSSKIVKKIEKLLTQ